jgi:protein tyrosine/serine phosphatase
MNIDLEGYCGLRVLLLAVCLLTGFTQMSRAEDGFSGDEAAKTYSNLDFKNDPDNFQFAIIGDRAGGYRPGVFPAAVDTLNLLQPELILSVGDFIEGYIEDESELKAQWAAVDKEVTQLEMPLFFVAGNHDVNLDPSEKVWFNRAGADRSYSHFVYKDVLFLLLSTEDPPKNDPGPELGEKYEALKAGKYSGAEANAIIRELEDWAGQVNISDAQVEYFERVLAENSAVRWTFAFMHSPPWMQPEPGNFVKIESLLADRPYTMFAGHTHTYDYRQRNGRDYITMAMTGGAIPGRSTGHMDHVAWVTMGDEGPIISNVLMNGVLDKRGAVPALQDALLFRPRQITQTGLSLGIKSVPNLRDLGGYKTSDGRVVSSGLVYRSNQLSRIPAGDMEMLAMLGLERAYDLRTAAERKYQPGELPRGVNYVWLDVLADSPQAGPAQLEALMKDPEQANEALGGGKAAAGFAESYREFVSLPSAQKSYRKLFLELGDREQLPALFHCTTGKDRTGWAAAAFLTLMGVPKETVYEDYLRSNDYILRAYKRPIDQFIAAGIDPDIPAAILGVKKEYLDAAFDQMEKKYGSIEKYFSKGLGINADQQKAMRDLYLK